MTSASDLAASLARLRQATEVPIAASGERPKKVTTCPIAAKGGGADRDTPGRRDFQAYTWVCSAISRASSTSIPRYRTVLSSLESPNNSCTARRFFVRR
jgi:hypothetical protein